MCMRERRGGERGRVGCVYVYIYVTHTPVLSCSLAAVIGHTTAQMGGARLGCYGACAHLCNVSSPRLWNHLKHTTHYSSTLFRYRFLLLYQSFVSLLVTFASEEHLALLTLDLSRRHLYTTVIVNSAEIFSYAECAPTCS